MSPNVLDLFAGAGGLSQGFSVAGFDVLAAIDKDEAALDTYRRNHSAPAYRIDITEVPPVGVCEMINIDPAEVDVVAGGPPCQSFSLMGERDSDDPRGDLIRRYFDFVEHFEPSAFVMENVPGMLSMEDGAIIEWVTDRAEGIGFKVEYAKLDASDYGIPQARNRVMVIGTRTGKPELPEPTHENPIPVWAALTGIPLMTLPNNGWSNHTDSTIGKYRDTAIGNDPHEGNTQIRLDPESPSRTVLASNRHFHPNQPRELSVREAAVLQSFPLCYEFFGTQQEQIRQVGNAVPPVLAEQVAETVLDILDDDLKQNPTDAVGMSMQEIANIGGRLTSREVEALLYRAEGWEWSNIADEMGVAVSTAHEYHHRAEEKVEEAHETIKMFDRLAQIDD